MEKEFENDFLKDGKIKMDGAIVKWALKFAFRLERKLFIAWVLFYLLCAVVPTLFLGLVSRMVDEVQENVELGNGMESTVVVLVILTVVMLVNGVVTQIPRIMWLRLANTYNIGLQRKMAQFMRKIPVRFFDDSQTAKLMTMAQSNEGTLGFFIANFFLLISNGLTLVSMMVLAWNTSWILLAVMVVFLSIALPLGTYNAKLSYQTWTEQSEKERIADYYLNLVMKKNPKDARLLQMGPYNMKKWRQARRPTVDAWIKVDKKSADTWSMMGLIICITKFGLLLVGLFLLKKEQLTLGGLTLFVSVFSQMGSIAEHMGYNWMDSYKHSCSLKFLKLFFEWDFSKKREPEAGKPIQPTLPQKGESPIVFECKNVSFSYDRKNHVLHNLSLCIHKGETIALVGENGAGKSTLIKLLLGLYDPDEGEIFFEGINYRNLDMSMLLDRVGVVFQDFVRFELMVRENVAFGDIKKVRNDQELRKAVELGGAGHVVDKLPKGLDTYLGRWYEKDGGEMSGGEWQRIAVSRAHISDREILIMDEPAAALDPIAEMEQFSRIKHTLSDRTSILISHRIGFARLADKIVVLQHGEVAEYGSHEDLMEKQGIYYQMFINQAAWYQKEVE